MCSLDTNIFKEENISSIVFTDWNKTYIKVMIWYKNGKQEALLIRKGRNYTSKLIRSLKDIYEKLKKN